MRHYQHIMQGSVERPQGQDSEKGTCLDTITVQLLNEGVWAATAQYFVIWAGMKHALFAIGNIDVQHLTEGPWL